MMETHALSPDAPDLRAALEQAGLPTEDLGEGGRSFFRFDDGEQAVGYGGFELYGEDALLRSVVVVPESRGKGYGRAVTEAVLREAFERGARRAYLLTTSAQAFFEHEGFTTIERGAAPQSILQTRQAATICSSAAMLARALDKND